MRWDKLKRDEAWAIYRASREEGVQLTEADRYLVDEALEYLLRTALPGDESVMAYNLAYNYYEQGKYALALKYYEYGIQKNGDCLCCEKAGAMCYYGDGVPVDYEKAFRYLKAAYEGRWHGSSYLLAEMYRQGIYVEKDLAKADEILTKYRDSRFGHNLKK